MPLRRSSNPGPTARAVAPGTRLVLPFPAETLPEWVVVRAWGRRAWLLAAVDDVPGVRDQDCLVRLPGAPTPSVVRHGPWVVVPEAVLLSAQALSPLDPHALERVGATLDEALAGDLLDTPRGRQATLDPELTLHLAALARDARVLAEAVEGRALMEVEELRANLPARPSPPGTPWWRSRASWVSGAVALAAAVAAVLWLRPQPLLRAHPDLYAARSQGGEVGVELWDARGACQAVGFPEHRECEGSTGALRYRLDPQVGLRYLSVWSAGGERLLLQVGPLTPTSDGGHERCAGGMCPVPEAPLAALEGQRRVRAVVSDGPAAEGRWAELTSGQGFVEFVFDLAGTRQ